MKIGDVNFEAFGAVLDLELTLKLQQNLLLNVVAIVGGQNIENDLLIFLDAPADSGTAIERCQILWKI